MWAASVWVGVGAQEIKVKKKLRSRRCFICMPYLYVLKMGYHGKVMENKKKEIIRIGKKRTMKPREHVLEVFKIRVWRVYAWEEGQDLGETKARRTHMEAFMIQMQRE